jgi:two-component system, OmpR family, copper resistance phosphate regulon response regulator CusR
MLGTMAGGRLRVLVVEDDPKVANALKMGLEAEHHAISLAHSGEEAFFLSTTQTFDLMLLDLGLPGRSGLEILRGLRLQGNLTPVLILTAKDAIEDRVSGLDAGGDDYLVKPFAFPELLARIRALTRRGRGEPPTRLKLANLSVDCLTRKVMRGDREIELTPKEFELLECLLRHREQTVAREILSREVWQAAARFSSLDNVIDVHIARLRKKLDDPFEQKMLKTIYGVGFMLTEGGS